MADGRAVGDDALPRNPVVRHGRTPDPVLRRDRDPLPDGYAAGISRRAGHRRPPPADAAAAGSITPGAGTRHPWDDAAGPDGPGLDERGLDPALDPDPWLLPELEAGLDPALTPDAATPLRGPEPGPLQAVKRKLGKALVPGERVLVAQTRHPVVLAEPVITSLLVLLGIAAVSPYLGAADIVRNVMMAGWVALAVRGLWAWLQWSNDYFVVTDRRLIRLHGIFDVQRDMMPLTKVTDMAFERPFWGRPFNYGRFVLESAGQDQALRVISFVRDPDNVDALIGRQIFARPPFLSPGGGR